eukprot:GHVU01110899.1.p3 GENE.GHVU01110899.1~~GHVU01110899.1.p3  ORF type:complete len:114 (-),score=30.50 GHVU01110899.1:638-979(-)
MSRVVGPQEPHLAFLADARYLPIDASRKGGVVMLKDTRPEADAGYFHSPFSSASTSQSPQQPSGAAAAGAETTSAAAGGGAAPQDDADDPKPPQDDESDSVPVPEAFNWPGLQ